MAGFQVLEEQFSNQGFSVLAFYSNDFGSQGGSDEQIETCTNDYGVTFQGFQIAPVSGSSPRDVFAWILSQPDPGPDSGGLEPTWNFHKYLISKDGELVAHFGRMVYPGDDPANPNDDFNTNPIVVAIQEELAK